MIHYQRSAQRRNQMIDNGSAAGCEATALPRRKVRRSIWAVPLV